MPANANYDDILSTTLANHKSEMVDTIFTSRVLTFFLKQADQVKMISGGHKIVRPLMYAKNTTAGSYTGSDVLPTTAQSGLSASEYDWKQYAVSVTIEGLEEAQNASEEQVIDLLDARVTQAQETILENWDTMFLSDGTGNSGKDWNGLKNLVAQNTATVGNIDPVANTWWRSNLDSSTTSFTVKNLGHMYNTVAVGNDKPNLLLGTQYGYEKYESLIQSAQRFQDSTAADAGFENIMFKNAPFLYDANVTGATDGSADYLYFLNTRYLQLVGHTQKWFYSTPFKQPDNQDVRVAQILCYGNLVVTNRKRQGAFTALNCS